MILLMEEIPKQPPGMFCKPRKKWWDIYPKKKLVQDFYPPRENSFPLRLVTNTGKQLENGGALMQKNSVGCFWGEGGLGWTNVACLGRSFLCISWGTKKLWRFWKF